MTVASDSWKVGFWQAANDEYFERRKDNSDDDEKLKVLENMGGTEHQAQCRCVRGRRRWYEGWSAVRS